MSNLWVKWASLQTVIHKNYQAFQITKQWNSKVYSISFNWLTGSQITGNSNMRKGSLARRYVSDSRGPEGPKNSLNWSNSRLMAEWVIVLSPHPICPLTPNTLSTTVRKTKLASLLVDSFRILPTSSHLMCSWGSLRAFCRRTWIKKIK